MRLVRRTFLKASTAALALSRCGENTAESDPPLEPEPEPNDNAMPFALDVAALSEDSALFTRGVQAGGMEETRAVLWSHTTDDTEKTLYVWRERATGEKLLAHRSVVTPQDGFLKTIVEGLGAGHYFYAFTHQETARSPIGHFRTAFRAGDLRPLTISGLTCTSLRHRPYTALHQAAADRADLFCHLGDMSYNDSAEDLEQYRAKWAETLSEPGYIAAYGSGGFYSTWDDHEFDNNYDPEHMAKFEYSRLQAAKRSYFETLAIEELPDYRLWRSFRWGNTAEFFIADSRSERLPSTIETDHPQYISREQMDWLKQGLVASPCRFKIILNSVPMTRLPEVWDFAGYDRWIGYKAQRDELLDHLTAHQVEGVIFLSGDFHVGFIGRVERSGFARNYWEIAVGPTANGPNPLPVYAETGDLPIDEIFPVDQFPYFSGTHMASTLITLDPRKKTIHVRYVDARPMRAGTVLFDQTLPTE